jgi:hypothetical protein
MKSRPFDVITSPLTERAVRQYMLEGKYGVAKQKWAQAQEKLKAATKTSRRSVSKSDTKKPVVISQELQALIDI